ncbi:MAG: hypothetical protein C0390_01650 [Syntrophus sp. (in: bacteria)]|nr:hypothetical protein [Syntrophus sp. (in: bacteria)]
MDCLLTQSDTERILAMKTKEIIITCMIAALVMVIAPMQSQAQTQQGGHIRFGNLAIIPGIALDGVYDDNIYMGNGKQYTDSATTRRELKESDWITHAKPSLLLSYTLPERGSVNLGYQGDYAFYDKNNSNNWKNNQGSLLVDYQAPGGLILGVGERFTASEDPYGSADQYAIGRTTKRWTNDAKTKLGYNIMANLRSFVYYNNYKQQYNDIADYSQDYTDSELGLGMESRFLPKTWGFIRYHYGQRRYNTNAPGQGDDYNSNSKWHRANVGLTWDPGAKLSGEVSLGYLWRKYDHEYTSATQMAKRDDKKTWVAETTVTFMPTAMTMLTMTLNRAIRDTASDTNEQFTDTGIGLNLQQTFLTKFTLNAGVGYSKNEYNLPVANARTDDNYLANIGLDYNIREWLGVGIGYYLNRKNSNIDTNEFTDNKFMISLKVLF